MRLLLHDYGNYGFSNQLAVSLARHGWNVTYAFNAMVDGPNAKFVPKQDIGVRRLPINRHRSIKHSQSFSSRLRVELTHAASLISQVRNETFDAILSANAPSLVQSRLAQVCHAKGIPLYSWVQDLYGLAAHKLLSKKLPVVGEIIGRYFIHLDKRSMRSSAKVILITDDFKPFARSAGLADTDLHVIENWAPLEDIPLVQKDNAWAQAQGLDPKVFRFVYTGTLAMKHNPQLLVDLSRALLRAQAEGQTAAELLVASASPGAVWLEKQVRDQNLTNVRFLGFQSSDSIPSLLGSADVLLAVLEYDAATFSVPSKVLTFLCAGKPLLAAIPGDNLAARIITTTGSGKVVEPTESEKFCQSALAMMQVPPTQRAEWGGAARSYAEKHFNLERITDQFMSILKAPVGHAR